MNKQPIEHQASVSRNLARPSLKKPSKPYRTRYSPQKTRVAATRDNISIQKDSLHRSDGSRDNRHVRPARLSNPSPFCYALTRENTGFRTNPAGGNLAQKLICLSTPNSRHSPNKAKQLRYSYIMRRDARHTQA